MRRARSQHRTGTRTRPLSLPTFCPAPCAARVNDEPVKVYEAGESWFEAPGAHHRVSENASTTEPARMLAIFVADSSEKTLTTRDPQ
jgi:hypothetical protein